MVETEHIDDIQVEKKISKQQFFKDVRHEIEMLKTHATKEEKNALNFTDFNPVEIYNCIYGQMTGDCRSLRAKELMDLSCVRVMDLVHGVDSDEDNNFVFDSPKFTINGLYNSANTWFGYQGNGIYARSWKHLSALEGYINLKNAKNKNVIAYIKGEIDKLIL